MSLRRSCFLILAMAVPVGASPQSPPAEGERIRVHQASVEGHALEPNRVYEQWRIATGLVQTVSPSEIRLLNASGTEMVIPRDEIAWIERSLGRHRMFVRNLLVTAVTTGLVVGTLSAVTWTPCQSWCFDGNSPAGAFALGFVMGGGVIGVPLGIIIGSVARPERWERLPLSGPERHAFSIHPVLGRGFGLSASIAFGGR